MRLISSLVILGFISLVGGCVSTHPIPRYEIYTLGLAYQLDDECKELGKDDLLDLKCWVWNTEPVPIQISPLPSFWDLRLSNNTNLSTVASFELIEGGRGKMVTLPAASRVPYSKPKLWDNSEMIKLKPFELDIPVWAYRSVDPAEEFAVLRVVFYGDSGKQGVIRCAIGQTLIPLRMLNNKGTGIVE